MYRVKYKRGIAWRTLRNVVGDGLIEENNNRYFIFEDDSVIEVPGEGTLFWFSPERKQLHNNK